jgi:hypothetical protein
MAADLRETMTAGVWMEFRNAAGHSLGQAVFSDWRGKPLPAVGDTVVHPRPEQPDAPPLRGEVVSRTFDVQLSANGESEVWAYLVIEPVAEGRRRLLTAECSRN